MTPDPEPTIYLWGDDVALLNSRLEVISAMISEDHSIKEFGDIAEILLSKWRPT